MLQSELLKYLLFMLNAWLTTSASITLLSLRFIKPSMEMNVIWGGLKLPYVEK